MEMAYRERWKAEIAELQRILSGFDLGEERKWGKPCYTLDGQNVVIIQGFKHYCALGFFQGAVGQHVRHVPSNLSPSATP